MIEDLRSQAEDLFFALHNDCTHEETFDEIIADLNRFDTKLQRLVATGQMRKGIARALYVMATRE